jgi:hypothetical protein
MRMYGCVIVKPTGPDRDVMFGFRIFAADAPNAIGSMFKTLFDAIAIS